MWWRDDGLIPRNSTEAPTTAPESFGDIFYMKQEVEYILCAAIHFDDGILRTHHAQYGTGVVACGYRHHSCFALRPKGFIGKETQGFLTSRDRFVSRSEAKEIAIKAGQLLNEATADGLIFKNLFSEDLY